jgi:hypothetical protein
MSVIALTTTVSVKGSDFCTTSRMKNLDLNYSRCNKKQQKSV